MPSPREDAAVPTAPAALPFADLQVADEGHPDQVRPDKRYLCTPLHLAAALTRGVEVARALLGTGGPGALAVKDSLGHTPSDIAAYLCGRHHSAECRNLLLYLHRAEQHLLKHSC